MNNQQAHRWIANNSSFYTAEGLTFRAIVNNKGYEIMNNSENCWSKLYVKITNNNYDYIDPVIDYDSYVPSFRSKL